MIDKSILTSEVCRYMYWLSYSTIKLAENVKIYRMEDFIQYLVPVLSLCFSNVFCFIWDEGALLCWKIHKSNYVHIRQLLIELTSEQFIISKFHVCQFIKTTILSGAVLINNCFCVQSFWRACEVTCWFISANVEVNLLWSYSTVVHEGESFFSFMRAKFTHFVSFIIDKMEGNYLYEHLANNLYG